MVGSTLAFDLECALDSPVLPRDARLSRLLGNPVSVVHGARHREERKVHHTDGRLSNPNDVYCDLHHNPKYSD